VIETFFVWMCENDRYVHMEMFLKNNASPFSFCCPSANRR
jgi:hypothetical protein